MKDSRQPPRVRRLFEVYRDLPVMNSFHAHLMGKILARSRPRACLELGFKHGKSSIVIASHVAAWGGRLTTLDRLDGRTLSPSIDDLLAEFGLTDVVEVHCDADSYTWRLMKFLEEGRRFDFAYFDGGHTWDDTGFAFFLVDRLLTPGGWVVFDDLYWTQKQGLPPEAWPTGASDEWLSARHVERVWRLLVQRHLGYTDFEEFFDWAVARKAT